MKIGGEVEQLHFLEEVSSLVWDLLPGPIRVLGNGSNVLIDDQPLKGTVIVTRAVAAEEPKIISENIHELVIQVSAGMYLPTLSAWTSRRGWSGCEYMVGVPGTVGGAIVQNAGANDQDISMILESVETVDLQSREKSIVAGSACELAYRSSRFKRDDHKLLTRARLKLIKGDADSIAERVKKNLEYRKTSTPYTKASLGSVYTRIPDGSGGWIYPGKLIQDAGLKELRIGGAMVSAVHANYIVNEGNATYDDVISLMLDIEKRVLDHSGHRLHREILTWSDR